jgi:PPK2 family polyphosphate:nucleotide phosphotransferase
MPNELSNRETDKRKFAGGSDMNIKPSDVQKLASRFLVKPGKEINLVKDFATDDTAGLEKPDNAKEILQAGVEFLAAQQEKLYAENRRGLLVVLQALDAAGKDSTIAHVMSGINPQGCRVTSFKAPSAEELSHDYLWRCMQALPHRGMIGIFNRSHYEEVLVVRVHPAFLKGQRLPEHTLGKGLWKQRFEEINNFEKYLVNNGFEIVKIFLNVGKKEQCARQLERIDDPKKNWKFNAGDLEERKYWDDYLKAYEEVFNHTSTPWAPWYILPADQKWFTRIAAAAVIANKLIEMDPQYPTISEDDKQGMKGLRETLVNECGDPATTQKPKQKKAGKDKSNGKKK